MVDLELRRTADDRRLYALEGVGTVRLKGFASHTATAESGAARWHIARRGFWRRLIEATDEAGTVVGKFEPRGLHRGGKLRWRGSDFQLRAVSTWRERYALANGDREIAVLEGKSWGRRPVKVAVDDPGAVEPGLLLFTCFVVNGLAEEASGAAAASAGAAVSSG